MIRNVSYGAVGAVTIRTGTGNHVRKVSLIDLDIDGERCTKSRDLHVVTPCTAPSHVLKMALKHTINVGLGRGSNVWWRRVGTDVLPLRIPPSATARVDIYELFVVVGTLSHMVYHFGANVVMLILMTVQLVGKGIEEAIACKGEDASIDVH